VLVVRKDRCCGVRRSSMLSGSDRLEHVRGASARGLRPTAVELGVGAVSLSGTFGRFRPR